MKKELGIAYSVKRKSSKKKYAEGGEISISAKTEKRPMPDDTHSDSVQARQNSGDKAPKQDSWTDRSTAVQAQRPARVALSEPKMVESGVIRTKLRKNEHDLMHTIAPKMAHGGMAAPESGAGPEEDEVEHPARLEEDDDQRTLPVDEFMASRFAKGGHIEESEDNYADDGHHDSIAAAIMARRDRLHQMIDSGSMDEDHSAMMAEGGEVDLSMNADEEPNHEDQESFDALKKENYSESEGLDDLDSPADSNESGDEREGERADRHDRVGAIRSRMSNRQQR